MLDTDTSTQNLGLSCCHTRFLKDVFTFKPFPFVPNNEIISIERSYFIDAKITKGEDLCHEKVIVLAIKKHLIFSVHVIV